MVADKPGTESLTDPPIATGSLRETRRPSACEPGEMNRRLIASLALLLAIGGCGDDTSAADAASGADAPASDGNATDAPEGDAPEQDAGERMDVPAIDAGGMEIPTLPGPLAWEDCEGSGRTLTAGPDDYRDVLETLMPGDTLQLAAGTYLRGLPVSVSGEEGRCIVIEGQAGARPLFHGSDAFNIIAFRGASWIKVRGFDIDGLGLGGFGVASQGADVPVHHIVVEDLEMIGLAGNQQITGISTKTPAWDWVIRGNRILEAGTGMYLGNSNGRLPFIGGLIEGNLIVDPLGYCMQIKHQNEEGRGGLGLPGLPDEATTTIRYNVFAGAVRGGGDGARPNVLIGDVPPTGSGSSDQYLVYGNLFYENPTENLFQGEGNIALYSNVFFTTSMGAILIRPHNGVPRNIEVVHNTIIAAGRSISVSGGAAGYTQMIHSNVAFSGSPIRGDGAEVSNNLEGSVTDAAGALIGAAGAIGVDLDLRPQSAEAVMGEERVTDVPRGGLDFDGHIRSDATRGAYEPGQMGWRLALENR